MEKIHYSEICIVCLDKDSSHIFKPCLHMCICDVCTHEYVKRAENTCPMCRKQYTTVEFHERPPLETVEDDYDGLLAKALQISEEEAANNSLLEKIMKDNYEQLLAAALKLSEQEALSHKILKNEEEEYYMWDLLESLRCEDNKLPRFFEYQIQELEATTREIELPLSRNVTNLAPINVNNTQSDISKGAIPKTSRPFTSNLSATSVNDFLAASSSTSCSISQNSTVSALNTPLDIYVQLYENATVYYNKNRRRTSDHSTGRMSLIIFSKDLSLNTLRNISSDDSLLFKFDNSSTVRNIEHDSSVQSQIAADKNHVYIACDELVPKLRDLVTQNSSSFSYNLTVFNYSINIDKYPLDIDFLFYGDSNTSQLSINYKYHPERIYPKAPLRKFKLTVEFVVPFYNVDCVPTATVILEKKQLYWSLDEIAKSGCLNAKLTFAKKRPIVARIRVEYNCHDALLSGMNLDEAGITISPNYRIKGIGRRTTIKEFFIVVENNNIS